MRVTGFSGILAGLAAATVLALLSLPALAAGGGGSHSAPDPAPAAAATPLPPRPIALLDVPADELSPTLLPAEPPPPDFTAAQFIDSAGCVFVRVPNGWRARIARDGSAICGYPPTFSARRTGPDDVAPLFPEPEEPLPARMERVLSEAILGDLGDGELSASQGTSHERAAASPPASPQDNQPMADREAIQTAVAPAKDDPLSVAAVMSAAPALQRQMAGRATETDQLCGLLGAAPAGQGYGSMALGLCGAAPALPSAVPYAVPRVAAARPANTVAAPVAAAGPGGTSDAVGSVNAVSRTVRDAGAPAGGAPAKTAAKASDKTKEHSPGRAGKDRAVPPMMIPPGAKYVQIGAFRDAANADRAARRLTEMGLPVVRAGGQGKNPMLLVMVGPLDGREAMVRMIDRLRRAGYRDPYPRR